TSLRVASSSVSGVTQPSSTRPGWATRLPSGARFVRAYTWLLLTAYTVPVPFTRAAIVPVAQSAAVTLPVDTPIGTGGQNSPVGVTAGGGGPRTDGAKSRGATPPPLGFRRAKSSPVTATTTGTHARRAG